jgi:PEGA domain
VPAPPEGTYTAPRTAPPITPPMPAPAASPTAVGVLEMRVQPLTATVMVDGERWMSSDEGWYELQLPVGAHRVDVTAPGHRPFTATVDVAADATTPLNVSLTREKTQ